MVILNKAGYPALFLFVFIFLGHDKIKGCY